MPLAEYIDKEMHMKCPKCNSVKVSVTSELASSTTKATNRGFFMFLFFGLFYLVWWIITLPFKIIARVFGKGKTIAKTTYNNRTVAICQDCGNKWDVA